MKIALTGASGFLGRHIAQAARQAGHELSIWSAGGSPQNPSTTTEAGNVVSTTDGPSIRVVRGRLGPDIGPALELCDGQDAVIHAGWWTPGDSFIGGEGDPQAYAQTNVAGSAALLQAAAECQVKRFVFISSGAVFGEIHGDGPICESHPRTGTSVYGTAKASVEILIESFHGKAESFDGKAESFDGKIESFDRLAAALRGNDKPRDHRGIDSAPPLAACTLRPTSIYGLDDPIESSRGFDLVRSIVAGETVSVSGGGKWVAASDAAGAALHLVGLPFDTVAGQTFHCTGGWVSRHRIATIVDRLRGIHGNWTGEETPVGREMSTLKLRQTGFEFHQDRNLEATLATLVRHAESAAG
ncbi:MAG: NAD(P)-dependent oxidoreductase [Planctomycetota bacterium]